MRHFATRHKYRNDDLVVERIDLPRPPMQRMSAIEALAFKWFAGIEFAAPKTKGRVAQRHWSFR